MSNHEASRSSTTDGVAVAPSMGPLLESAHVGHTRQVAGKRLLIMVALALPIAVAAGFVAQLLTQLISLITNAAFYWRWSTAFISPAGHHLGLWVILVPVLGGIVVGLMARYGSKAIRGHGIPEAMEQVLFNESRVPPRVTFLKPLSAAIAIGTGGPFGAEGPIIATGGALGSMFGQLMKTTADERKTLLAAGAAAGMAATFGSPVSAVLLAIELLLFEYRAESFIPVAFASAIATAIRMAINGSQPIFAMPALAPASGAALLGYIGIGAVAGLASVAVSRALYAIEDAFERLPIHWMWWPALGGIAVGIVGYFSPRTMGVGYENIDAIVSGNLTDWALATLLVMKFISWSISLGSGTSGGTLAPLFTIGGALGGLMGASLAKIFPSIGMDPRAAALVGMAAIFAGAAQALLASVVFAFETTLQPFGLLPLLGGCSMAYLVARLLTENSIMTEKIARRGLAVSTEYTADFLSSLRVSDAATLNVVGLRAGQTVGEVRNWLDSHGTGTTHTGFPITNDADELIGVITRKNLSGREISPSAPIASLITRSPVVIAESATLREALDLMMTEGVGRLPLVPRHKPRQVTGIVTRSDLLALYGRKLDESRQLKRSLKIPFLKA